MNRFYQLAKGVAESVTRRQALKQFGGGLLGIALASFGLSSQANNSHCIQPGFPCGKPGQGGCGATPAAYLIDQQGVICRDVAVGAESILNLLVGATRKEQIIA